MRDPEEVREWIRKAEADFEGAIHLQRRRKHPLPDLVCFHCQQCAEKYLKGILIFQEIAFKKIHDMELLLDLAVKLEPGLELWREFFEFLNPYSVQFRYPGEDASVEEAKQAILTVKRLRLYLRSCFPPELLKS